MDDKSKTGHFSFHENEVGLWEVTDETGAIVAVVNSELDALKEIMSRINERVKPRKTRSAEREALLASAPTERDRRIVADGMQVIDEIGKKYKDWYSELLKRTSRDEAVETVSALLGSFWVAFLCSVAKEKPHLTGAHYLRYYNQQLIHDLIEADRYLAAENNMEF